MKHATDEPTLVARCPACGKGYRVPHTHAGRSARCACGHVFIVDAVSVGQAPAPPPQAAPAPPQPAPPPRIESSQGVCIVCQTPPAEGDALVGCPVCHAVHHQDCWEYNGGCGQYGCQAAPPTHKLEEIEIPASHWGQTEKHCPQCGQMIQAAAIRCRHCGATFSTARPQIAGEYMAEKQLEIALPTTRAGVIWFLVGAVITCTAPIALIVGGLWYLNNRDKVGRLPSHFRAMAVIALGLSIAQTTLLLVVAIVHSVL